MSKAYDEKWLVVAMIEEAFPLTMAIEILCLSHAVSLFSPDIAVIRLPSSEINLAVDGP